MSARHASRLALVALAALAVAACAAPAAVAPTPSSPPTSSPFTPTPVPGTASPDPEPTASPNAGDVDGSGYPELAVERVRPDVIRATVIDPEAKAWRIVVAGRGDAAGARFEIVVEAGDIGPTVQAREILDGTLVGIIDLTPAIGEPTVAVGGCHAAMAVCVASDGFRLPADGDGTVSVELALPQVTSLAITGATATWPEEPFVLGPWTETEAFPWP
jgi:hypothetical protein